MGHDTSQPLVKPYNLVGKPVFSLDCFDMKTVDSEVEFLGLSRMF